MPDGLYRQCFTSSQADCEVEPSKIGDLRDLVQRLKIGDVSETYPARAASLNYFSKHAATRKLFQDLARNLRQVAERQLLGDLRGNSWQVLCALYARTLGFQKIAEAVTYDHVMFGVREEGKSSPPKRHQGQPIFKGTSLRSRMNESIAFKDLCNRGLISRYIYRESHAEHIIYSAIPIWVLRYHVLGHFASFPSHPTAQDIPDQWSEFALQFHRATRLFDPHEPAHDHVFWSLIDQGCREKLDAFDALPSNSRPFAPA